MTALRFGGFKWVSFHVFWVLLTDGLILYLTKVACEKIVVRPTFRHTFFCRRK